MEYEELIENVQQWAKSKGSDYKGALEEAWETIKDRQGVLKDGVFVKKEDL